MAWTEIPETIWLETEEDCVKAVEYLLPKCINLYSTLY